MRDPYHTSTLEHRDHTFRVDLHLDLDKGPPWEEHECHGPVSEWTDRAKRPGEWTIAEDRRAGQRRYYDVRAATAQARRDHWGLPKGESPEGHTARTIAARAVQADYEYLKGWADDEWHWCGVEVTLLDGRKPTRYSATLWGIESNATDYLAEVARDLAGECLEEAAEWKTCPCCQGEGRVSA